MVRSMLRELISEFRIHKRIHFIIQNGSSEIGTDQLFLGRFLVCICRIYFIL